MVKYFVYRLTTDGKVLCSLLFYCKYYSSILLVTCLLVCQLGIGLFDGTDTCTGCPRLFNYLLLKRPPYWPPIDTSWPSIDIQLLLQQKCCDNSLLSPIWPLSDLGPFVLGTGINLHINFAQQDEGNQQNGPLSAY